MAFTAHVAGGPWYFSSRVAGDAAVSLVRGLLITDSRGLFDALTRHGAPQLELRSAGAGEGLSAAGQQLRASGATTCQVNGLAQLADSPIKLGSAARPPFWQRVQNGFRWQCKYDEKFESAKKRSNRNAGVHKSVDSNDETTAEFRTLLPD